MLFFYSYFFISNSGCGFDVAGRRALQLFLKTLSLTTTTTTPHLEKIWTSHSLVVTFIFVYFRIFLSYFLVDTGFVLVRRDVMIYIFGHRLVVPPSFPNDK